MKLHAQGPPPPFGDPADLTAVLLQSFAEKPRLQVPTASLATGNKELIDWNDPFTRFNRASFHGLCPSRLRKAKAFAAFAHRQPIVHRHLNLVPVIATSASIISGNLKSPRVIRHRRLRNTEATTDRVVAQPLRPQTANELPALRRALDRAFDTRHDVPASNGSMPNPVGKSKRALAFLTSVSSLVIVTNSLPIDILHCEHMFAEGSVVAAMR